MAKIPPADFMMPESTIAAVAAINTFLQEAVNKPVGWSKPHQKSKARCTPEITALKITLNKERRDAGWHGGDAACPRAMKEATRVWCRAIRHRQWEYWEKTFRSTDQASGLRVMKVADKTKAAAMLPDIQGVSCFQGKCQIFQDSFFPTSVDTTPTTPPGFLPPIEGPE